MGRKKQEFMCISHEWSMLGPQQLKLIRKKKVQELGVTRVLHLDMYYFLPRARKVLSMAQRNMVNSTVL